MNKLLALGTTGVLLISGCGGGGGYNDHGSNDYAYLSIGVTDATVDSAQHVYVQFHGVELQGPNGLVTENFATPMQIDLMSKTGTNSALLLDNVSVRAGNYEWIRLLVDTTGPNDSYVVAADGTSNELTIPSGEETGLKLNSGFTIAAGGHSAFTIDFDLRRSIIQDSTGFKLKPRLRIVNNQTVGQLSGHVSAALITTVCAANQYGAVYVYEGTVIADDVGGSGAQPITSARVASDGTGNYMVGFLAPGTYTAAWTCDAINDDPTTDDNVFFLGTASVTIMANATATLDFS